MRTSPSPTKTRELVIQALYQKTISGDSNTKVLKELKQTQKNLKTDKGADIVNNITSLEQYFLETGVPRKPLGGLWVAWMCFQGLV